MKLTLKCKEEFEKWFNKGSHDEEYNNHMGFKFERSHPSMQYGVLVDFFDSVGLHIEDYYKTQFGKEKKEWMFCVNEDFNDNGVETRQKARTKAIEKANEIFNKQ